MGSTINIRKAARPQGSGPARRAATRVAFALLASAGGVVGAGVTAGTAAAGTMTIAGTADWDHDGHTDIVSRKDTTGKLYLYRGTSTRGYSADPNPYEIGTGWNGFTFGGLTDWDRDGHVDIIARDDATGKVYLYRGSSTRGYSRFAGRYEIGNGFNGYTFAGVPDWDRDGYPDFVVRDDATGKVYLLRGAGVRGYSPYANTRYEIGNGFSGYTFAGTPDWDRDGYADFVVNNLATNKVILLRGAGRRGYSPYPTAYEIGNGFNGYTFAGLSDWDRDGSVDYVARNNATSKLYLYRGASVRGYSPYGAPFEIGSGW